MPKTTLTRLMIRQIYHFTVRLGEMSGLTESVIITLKEHFALRADSGENTALGATGLVLLNPVIESSKNIRSKHEFP